MKTYQSIIVAGTIAYDEIMDYPDLFVKHFDPKKLHQISVSFVVDRLDKQLGGTATNISYNISQLINHDQQALVSVLGAIGKDGQPFLDFFKKNQINTNEIIQDDSLYTATGKVMTDLADNQIWGYYYGASSKAKKISLKKFANSNSLLVLSATHQEAFLHFQKSAIKYKIDYLYDPGMTLTWISDQDLLNGIAHCKWLIGNDYEIGMIFKRLKITAPQLLRKNISIITTLGSKGVKYQSPTSSHQPPATTCISAFNTKVIDPTGAGDAWRGGFVAGLVNGNSITQCLRLGNVMASFAIENYGTVNHQPTLKEINNRLKSLL